MPRRGGTEPQLPAAVRIVNTAPRPTDVPLLRLIPRDKMAAMIEEADERIDAARGEMVEYPPATPRGKVLFRYTDLTGEETAFSVNADRLSAHVRALWWELAEAVEAEGRR